MVDANLFKDLDTVEVTANRGSRVATVGRIVFGFSFFIREPYSTEARQRLVAATDHLLSLIPVDSYRWWLLHGEGNPKRLPQTRPPAPSEILRRSDKEDLPFAFKLWDSEPHDAAAPRHYLEFFCLGESLADQNIAPIGTLQFYVPLPWLEQQAPGTAPHLFRHIVQTLQPFHATAGLTLSSPVTPGWQQSAGEALYEVLNRFPGLEIGYAWQMSDSLSERMGTVNWLTAVHHDLLDLCGGAAAVKKTLSAISLVDEYAHGLIIQAGAAPQLGDRSSNIPIPTYNAVAAALRPARIEYAGMVINPSVQKPGSDFSDDVLDQGQLAYLTRLDE